MFPRLIQLARVPFYLMFTLCYVLFERYQNDISSRQRQLTFQNVVVKKVTWFLLSFLHVRTLLRSRKFDSVKIPVLLKF